MSFKVRAATNSNTLGPITKMLARFCLGVVVCAVTPLSWAQSQYKCFVFFVHSRLTKAMIDSCS
jgi:hypothetical protein